MSSRGSNYEKNPNFSTLPEEILRHIALFLPREGVKPTRGKITSNYYNNSGIVAGNHGLRYQLVNSPTRPLTERTKQKFSNAQKQGKNVARIHKNEAAHKFLFGLYNMSKLGPAGVKPATGSPIGITSYVKASPHNSNNLEAVGGHMYLNANFKVGPNRTKKGTRDNFMRTSKSVRAAVRPGPKRRRWINRTPRSHRNSPTHNEKKAAISLNKLRQRAANAGSRSTTKVQNNNVSFYSMYHPNMRYGPHRVYSGEFF